ncbi:RHS repeat-associated core domain-containing protein [Vibrio harveyi]|uniref:RHS repeat domain-containing protein n=1 Tax=Vibrio harveyi TaxID=669 RepID=UPI001C948615|nr:RHS repeat-associated core domain-containing protein [Vibrio harveyi]MBY6239087.1 RHS repeat-associated core domain-containing protein [Vibrio harveyi]
MRTINYYIFILILISFNAVSNEFNGRVDYSYKTGNGNVNLYFPFKLYEKPVNINFDLGLRLNSTSSNSDGLGNGWSINGIQKITKCEANNYHDINDFDETKFCYGGKRLFLTHGKNQSNGARYKIEDNLDIVVTYLKNGTIKTRNGYFIDTSHIGLFKMENPNSAETYYFGGDNGFDYHHDMERYLIVRKEAEFNESIDYKYNENKVEGAKGTVGIRRFIDEISYGDIRVKFNYSWPFNNMIFPRLDSVNTFYEHRLYSNYDTHITSRKIGSTGYNSFSGFTECINGLCSDRVDIKVIDSNSYSYSVSNGNYDEKEYRNKIGLFGSISSKMEQILISQGNKDIIKFSFRTGLVKNEKNTNYSSSENYFHDKLNLLESYTEFSGGKKVKFSYFAPHFSYELNRFLTFSKIRKDIISVEGGSVTEENEFYTEYPKSGYIKKIIKSEEFVRKTVDYVYKTINKTRNIHEIKYESVITKDYDDNGKPINNKTSSFQYDSRSRLVKKNEKNVSLINNSNYEKISEYSMYGRSGVWFGESFQSALLPGRIENKFYVNGVYERSTFKDLFYDKFKIIKESFSDGNKINDTTTYYDYNKIGLVVKETVEFNKVSYNKDGTIEDIDQDSKTINTKYENNFIISSENYLGHTTKFIKDEKCNKPKESKDANGNVSKFVYDERCRLIESHYSNGSSRYKKYLKSEAFDVLGIESHFVIVESGNDIPTTKKYYDINGNNIRTSKVSLYGNIINVDYYKSLNFKKVSKPYFEGEQLYWETTRFNSLGQVNEINTALGTTLFFRNGNELKKIDAIGDVEIMYLDAKSRVIRRTFDNTNIEFKYDFNGNTVFANNSGVIDNYKYNSKDQIVRSENSTTGLIENKYDSFGNIIWSKNQNGKVTKVNYDKSNRITYRNIIKSNGKEKEDFYIWDTKPNGKGLLSRIYSGEFSLDYFYNESSNLKILKQRVNGREFEKKFYYDEFGRLSNTKFPNDIVLNKEFDDYGYIIGEYINNVNSIKKPTNAKLAQLKRNINSLKGKLYSQQLEDERIIKSLHEELKTLRERYYIHQSYAVNSGSNDFEDEIYVDDLGRIYRRNTNGEFFREYVGKIYDCNKWDDPRCNAIPEELIFEKIDNPNILLEDDTYLNVDGVTGATNFEIAGHFKTETLTKFKKYRDGKGGYFEEPVTSEHMKASFYRMRHGLSAESKRKIEKISTGLNDEIYRLNKTSGGYSELIEILVNLESKIEKKSKLYESRQFIINGVDRIRSNNSKYYIWTVDKLDQYNRVSSITHGNGTFTSKYYNPETTHLQTIKTISGDATLRDLEYGYDNVNNMLYRYDYVTGAREDYEYSTGQLERYIFSSKINGKRAYRTQHYYYDDIGNITSVSASGKGLDETNKDYEDQNYVYADSSHPYRVTSVNNNNYRYDSSGNILSYGNVNIDIGFYDKPIKIFDNEKYIAFDYDPNGNLFKQLNDSSVSYYFDSNFKQVSSGNQTVNEIYVSAYGELQAVLKSNSKKEFSVDYLYSDPLGSIDTVADSQGKVVQRYVYSPFGERKNLSLTTGFATKEIALTDKAFTGHEELHEFGLIHMGGRIYDPKLRRFISPDPIINDRTESSSYNLYSYVFNNPMKYTDPSGFVAAEASVSDSGVGPDISGDSLGTGDDSRDIEEQGSETAQGDEGTNNSDGFSFSNFVEAVSKIAAELTREISDAFRPNEYEVSLTLATLGSPVPFDDILAGSYWAGKGAVAVISGTYKVASRRMSMTAAETTMEEGLTFAQRTYQTYTKTNLSTGEVYTGRTSGFGTALQNVERRDLNHHKNKEGFGPAVLDVSSTNKAAIRGREQQLIEANGGAQSMGGTSGNAINGISPKNPNRETYINEANKEFGNQ